MNWSIRALFFFFFLLFLTLSLRPLLPSFVDLSSPKSEISIIPTLTPTPTPSPIVTLGLVGDLGLGRHITATARAKNNFNWSLEMISPWLLQNDFNLANLESPIIKNCPAGRTGTFIFCGDSRFLPYLAQNKFIFSLANNHILNYGLSGLAQTQDYLSDFNLPYIYSHQAADPVLIRDFNGISFVFLAFDLSGGHSVDKTLISQMVSQYHNQADWLVVSLHWGGEYLTHPESWRITLAHQLVAAGADIIHGHHPHVWQEPEVYHDSLIFYSLGNFIFDQSWSPQTSHSQIVRLTLDRQQILDWQTFPIAIKFNSQPVLETEPTPAK